MIRRTGICLVAALTLSLAPAATAQVVSGPRGGSDDARSARETIRPPKVEDPSSAPTWLYFLVGAAALGVCVALAVFPSRREFND
ncbi:MAG: hypothetical protein AAFX05_03650 [Planctomycetota bacterium]